MSVIKLVKQLELAHALNNNGSSPEWTWYCSKHNQAGFAPTKAEAEWLADSHQLFMAKSADESLLNDLDDNGVPKLSLEELSECSLEYLRKGIPNSKNVVMH